MAYDRRVRGPSRQVSTPRVNDRRSDADTVARQRFSAAILPAWAGKSPQMSEALPLLYLSGLSTSDFGPALEQFLGSGAGLSATTITRLTAQWQDEAKTFGQRDLSGTDYVYLWVDGIHLEVRLEQEKLCLLVMLSVRADGRKELVALSDGWPSVMGHWDSGKLSAKCSPPPRSSGADFTSKPMPLPRYRNQCTLVRWRFTSGLARDLYRCR